MTHKHKTEIAQYVGNMDSLLKNIREYVEITPCTCEGNTTCWRCMFAYYMSLLDGVPMKPKIRNKWLNNI